MGDAASIVLLTAGGGFLLILMICGVIAAILNGWYGHTKARRRGRVEWGRTAQLLTTKTKRRK